MNKLPFNFFNFAQQLFFGEPLAGLALAAAAFLLPLEQRKLDELKTAHQLTLAEVQQLLSSRKKQDRLAAIKEIDKLKTKVTSTEDEARLREFDQIDKALKILVWSFFFFAIALVDAILGDPLSDLEGVLDTRTLADLAVSGGGTIAGIACMVRSAFLIRRIVSPGKLEGEQNSDRESAAPGETSHHATKRPTLRSASRFFTHNDTRRIDRSLRIVLKEISISY